MTSARVLASPIPDKDKGRGQQRTADHRGATIQHPGWAGEYVGVQPFPTRLPGTQYWRVEAGKAPAAFPDP